jgi:hypothetical protein
MAWRRALRDATTPSGSGAAAWLCGRLACWTRIGASPSASANTISAPLRRCLAPDAYWVNDIEARERALLKSPQLTAAKSCGLAIPETLFSNDPDDIRRFYASHRRQGVIFKLCYQTHWLAQSTGARHALYRPSSATRICSTT